MGSKLTSECKDLYMRNKEHYAATKHLCQINDSGSPGNALVRAYRNFFKCLSGMERKEYLLVEINASFGTRVWNGKFIGNSHSGPSSKIVNNLSDLSCA